jgi:hypothetical protein
LSEPGNERVKGSKSPPKAKSGKRKSGGSMEDEEEEAEDSSDDGSEEGEEDAKPKKAKKGRGGVDLVKIEKGEMPNDATLREWVGCFVRCYDLEKASVKVALEVAGAKFGVDMAGKKDLLKDMLAEAMQ